MHQTMDKDTITVGALSVRFLVEAADSNGTAAVFSATCRRLNAAPTADGLRGRSAVEGARPGRSRRDDRIGPGEAVCVPRGAIHVFENRSGIDAKFLAIATPGVFGPDYFHEVGELLAASAGGPPDLAAVAEVMRRHGLTPAPRALACAAGRSTSPGRGRPF
jgi:hypothetical protein